MEIKNTYLSDTLVKGDIVSFNTNSWLDDQVLTGEVVYNERLGNYVVVDNKEYLVRKMVNLKKLN